MRADQLLVHRGLARSRTLAQRLIEAGRVRADDAVVRKAGEALQEDAALSVDAGDEGRYVSRGGLKLAGALAHTGVDPTGRTCLDVGQSTGGFTDALLAAGAARVIGIDVGHGQLDASLRDDPRVTAIEGINARDIGPMTLGDAMPAGGFGLIVVDVSFISITKVLPALLALATPGADLVALAKPQFEVGRDGLDRRGLVRDESLYPGVRNAIEQCARDAGWQCIDWLDSPIAGGDGNREFFLHARRPGGDANTTTNTKRPLR